MSPRVALAVAGLAALVLPFPSADLPGIVLTGVGLGALATSVRYPGTTAPAWLIGLSALSWLAGDGPAERFRLLALALALALVHSAAALAAVVPARSRVPAALLVRWAAWTGLATVAGVAAVGATALLPRADPVPTTVAALAALAVAVVGASVVVGVLQRRGAGDA